jgi:hypothetical protein
MSGTVTPIGSGDKPPRLPRPPKRNGLHLRESEESEGFCTREVLMGRHGVCLALDEGAVNDSCRDVDQVAELSIAARVLCSILVHRIEL